MTVALPLARMRAQNLVELLEPFCARIQIVGSIRRERPHVGDIEILLEPKSEPGDLFGSPAPVIEPIRRTLSRCGRFQLNGNRHIRLKTESINVDVFLVHPPSQWGTQQAIRTGPKELGKACVTMLREKGWRCHQGALWRPPGVEPDPDHRRTTTIEGRTYLEYPTPTEAEFFEACGVKLVNPSMRDQLASTLTAARSRRT